MQKNRSRIAAPRANLSAATFFLIAMMGGANSACAQENSTSSSGDDSKLRKFERSVQAAQQSSAPATAHYDSRNSPHAGTGFNLDSEFMDWIGELGQQTWQRLDLTEGGASRRNEGDFTIPFIRYDFAYQNVAASIHASSHRLEAGYGPFAVFLEEYTFKETSPDSTLTISRQLLLYRMSVDPMFEVDLGIGQSVVSGAESTSLSTLSLPVRVVLGENAALEFRPAWAGGMNDYELALHIGRQYGSVKVGYRVLNSPDSTLSGPFAGFSVYY
ncbi:MAG TPA: hypothetical protein VIU93_00485 [Gallionellaceae bacterium]